MVLNSIQKVWKSGSVLCVTVPMSVRKVMDINDGDMLQISWDEVIKMGKVIKKKEVKGTQEEQIKEFKREIKELPEI